MGFVRTWLPVILIGLLIGFVAGCAKTVILRNDEMITRHPTDPHKVCVDEGYMTEIFEALTRK